jgi:histidinol dehydrogenase
MMHFLETRDPEFSKVLAKRLEHDQPIASTIFETVTSIINDVRSLGDASLLAYSEQIDGLEANSVTSLRVPLSKIEAAPKRIDPATNRALALCTQRITDYHERQLTALGRSWQFTDDLGNSLGQRVRPMHRVGVYAPGGKACYPSTVLMTAIPAKVAGVESIALAVPVRDGEINPVLLAAAYYAGVDEIWMMGGAQAIAALAYGTESIERVDKICGPGNQYVTAAKKQVFGDVGIDMLAGPSEVLVVADEKTSVSWVIADLLAQAEHDEQAQSIVVSESESFLSAVQTGLAAAVSEQPRREIIETSLSNRGMLIHADSKAALLQVINQVAPEHLELAVSEPETLLSEVRAAGAIFVGPYSPEVVGDYSAGPSHVLPTGGTARFASALGVYDFQVRQSLIECRVDGVQAIASAAATLAEQEGLFAHARSALKRLEAD